jgi:cytochrome c-type biogenesis protein CcmH
MRGMLAILLMMLSLTPAFALTPDELLKDPAQEARARAISAELRCMVCQNQSIDDSDAALAKDLRTLVREQISAGKSDKEILDFVVDRYGEYVLLKPRLESGTILLWATPFAVLVIAAAALLLVRRKSQTLPEQPLTEAERKALQKALE